MIDFKKIISETTRYNFHSHTQYCDGRSTLEAIANSAADVGLLYLGFTPHSPIPVESPCNMAATDVPAYKAELLRVAQLLQDRCRLYCGMEIDYLGSQWGPATQYFADLGLDYSIGSVHFIPSQGGEYVDIDGHFDNFSRRMDKHFHRDIRYVVETYYEQSQRILSDGGFEILGHFDKIGQNASMYHPGIEQEGWYADLVDGYIDQILKSGVVVEINTKAYSEHHRFFPHIRYWKTLKDAGVPFMVNSDVHYADRVEASRFEAFEILNSINDGAR